MPVRLISRRVAGCLLAGFAATVSAHEEASERSFFEALPVVLTPSRLPQTLQDTPAAVSVIDADMIATTGYRDLGRLFRLVPGMQVAQERGHDQWVTYHGLGGDYPNQMQILVDGRSVYTPYFFGGADWGALPTRPEDIERIEIVRGTNSAAYGSNAFLGVVNIITHHTAAERGSSVVTHLGTQGIADATARAITQQGALGLRITASYQRDDGISALKDSRRVQSLTFRGDARMTDIDELMVSGGHTSGIRGQGFEGVLFDGSATRNARHEDSHLHLRWRRAPSDHEEWSLSWYHNREHTGEPWQVNSHANLQGTLGSRPDLLSLFSTTPPVIVDVDNNRNGRRNNLELQHRLRTSNELQWLWGLEWRQDWLVAESLFNDDKSMKRDEWRMFGNLEWRLQPTWLLNAGMMLEHIEGDQTRIAPRIFVNWQPAPYATWRAGYSAGWRQPSLFERNADVRVIHPYYGELQIRHQGNPDLRPQHIEALEIGFLGLLPRVAGSFDVRVFNERIRDYIVRRPVSFELDNILPSIGLPGSIFQDLLGGTRWDNASGTTRIIGAEYQLRVRPWKSGELMLNHTMMRLRHSDAAVNGSTAPYVASLSWLQRAGAWQSMLTLLRVGPSNAGTGYAANRDTELKAYTTLDASIARTIQVSGYPVELRVTGINLLGKHQELVHRPAEILPQYAGSKAANPMEPQVWLSLRANF